MLIALFLAASLSAPVSDDSARAVVTAAARAVADDGGAGAARIWRARLASAPEDSAAMLALATISRLTYDYETAEGLYKRLGSSRPTGRAWSLYASLGGAENHVWRVRYDSSAKEFERLADAARAQGATAVRAEALYWLANMRYHISGAPAGLAAVGRAKTATPRGDRASQARLHCLAAEMLTRESTPAVLDEVKQGLAAAMRVHDGASAAHCLVFQASYLYGAQPSMFVLVLLDSAVGIARSAHDDWEYAVAVGLRGYTFGTVQLLGASLRDLDECVGIARHARLDILEAWCRYYRAYPLRASGDRQSGRADIAFASGVFPKFGDGEGMIAIANAEGGTSLRDKRLDDAARAFGRLRVLSAATHSAAWEEAALIGLAEVHGGRGEWDLARRMLDSTAIFDRANHLDNPLSHEYGRVALGQGDFLTARREFGAAVHRAPASLPLLRYAPLARLAEIEARTGSLHAADSLLEAAEDELDAYRRTLKDSQLRPLAYETSQHWDDTPDLAIPTIIAALAQGGRARSAFHLAERRRARELGDQLLASRKTFEGFVANGADAASVRQLASAAKADSLPALDATSALLEYVTGPGGQPTTLFALTVNDVRAYALPPIDSLRDELTRFATLVEAGNDARTVATRLGRALLAPAVNALPGRVTHLTIVTDLGLHSLPFDALRLTDGRLVLERFAVSFAPSASVLRALQARPDRAARPVRLLALGDPSTARVTAAPAASSASALAKSTAFSGREVYRGAFDSAGGLPRLPAAAAEARGVAAFAQEAVVRLGADASEAWIKHAPLTGFRVIHFATHALVSESAVSRSAIALAPDSSEDGFLTATDVARLRLNADLVVLSACRTAGGVELRGEGVEGLTASFLQAGARSVAATRWRVGDRAIVQLIDDFYTGLADRLSVSDALQRAKLAAVARGASSREWAALTIIGDPAVHVPLQQPSVWRRWLARLRGR